MFLTEADVRAELTYEGLIPAIRQALMDYSAALVEQPARMMLRAGNAEGHNNGWFAVMPVIAGDVMAVKTVTFYPGNDELGLHTHMAIVELLRRSTGEPLAVMDGRLITEMRTAAVSAVALDVLGGTDVRSLGILGSGVQARSHLRAFGMVRPGLKDIRIWSRTADNAKRLAAETGARAVTIEEAAAADVVLTVTSAGTPILQGRWLAPHAECKAAAERESGDVRMSGVKVDAEVGAVAAGSTAAPQGRRIVFKSVGMAIEDLTAARLVWQSRASESK